MLRALSLMSLSLLALLSGCAMSGPPRWVETFPGGDDQFIYGVGSAGVTFDRNPSRSKQHAIERAMQDLSYQIKTEVVVISELRETSHSSTLTVDGINLSDSDLEGVEIVEIWTDTDGVAGRRGRTWVLVRLPMQRVEAIIARR